MTRQEILLWKYKSVALTPSSPQMFWNLTFLTGWLSYRNPLVPFAAHEDENVGWWLQNHLNQLKLFFSLFCVHVVLCLNDFYLGALCCCGPLKYFFKHPVCKQQSSQWIIIFHSKGTKSQPNLFTGAKREARQSTMPFDLSNSYKDTT